MSVTPYRYLQVVYSFETSHLLQCNKNKHYIVYHFSLLQSKSFLKKGTLCFSYTVAFSSRELQPKYKIKRLIDWEKCIP